MRLAPKYLLILLILTLTHPAGAQQLQWVKTIGSSHGYRLAIANNKYPIVLGAFNGTVDFDAGPGVFNMTSISTNDLYITKYDTTGQFIWAKQLGSPAQLEDDGLVTDLSGNIYILGEYQAATDFDPGPGQYILPATYVTDFVLKLDPNGNFVWVKSISGCQFHMLSIDAKNNLILGGYFGGTVDFDPGPGTANLTATGTTDNDMMVLKLDSAGNFVWVKQIKNAGSGQVEPLIIKTAPDGSVLFGGGFAATLDFDPGPGTATLTAGSDFDAFLLKLDAQGNYVWVKQFGSTGRDVIFGVAADKDGNVYSTGSFQNSVDFDPGPSSFILTSYPAEPNCFISKLDPNGNFLYAKTFSSRYSSGNALAVDSSNNLYVAGFFSDSLDLDPGPGTDLVKGGSLFTAKLDPNGNFVWGAPFLNGAPNFYETIWLDMQVDVMKNVYLTGNFPFAVDFDPGPGIDSVQPPGGINSFNTYLLRLSQCNNTLNLVNADTCDPYTFNGTTYVVLGTYYQMLTNSVGCDSIIQVNVARKTAHTLLSATSCGSYLWNGKLLTATGAYTDTLPAVTVCDSILQLSLTLTSKVTSLSKTVCGSYNWNGTQLTSSGTYADTIHLAGGCDSIVKLDLQVNPNPSLFLGNDTVLCRGDSITLHAGSFTSYFWSNGSTGSDLLVTDTGVYRVQVTDANACTTADSIHIRPSGQCNCILDDRTKIYPTPFKSLLMIDKQSTQCEVRMNLYNAIGQLLARGVLIRNGHNEIQLSGLPSGVYVYKLYSDQQILLSGKILKLP